MKFRGGTEKEDVKLNMTSLIDIVFQLLIFFIMTFKITALEGDFRISMPIEGEQQMDFDEPLDNTILVYLQEKADHSLQGLQITFRGETTTFTQGAGSDAFAALHEFIRNLVEQGTDPSAGKELEVEFENDHDLAFGETIQAIEAVSARVGEDRSIIPLIEKIKFKDSKK